MNVVVVGKPRIDVTEFVKEFPNEGNDVVLDNREIIAGGSSLYTACMLAKWGINVTYMGLVGGEEEGVKLKTLLEERRINTRFVEINYETKTNKNYSILSENGKRTNLIYDNQKYLTKYKLDFEPDYIISDGTDFDGALGLVNNYPNAKVIFLANVLSKDYYNFSKKCTYVVSNEKFASAATKLTINYHKQKTLVDLMQKLQDLENAKYIIILRGNGTLYVKERQVKFISKVDATLRDEYMMETAFFAAFAYGIITNMDMDKIGKLCNMAYYKSGEKIGNINNILDKDEMFKLCNINNKEELAPSEETLTEQKTENVKEEASSE